jgi:hypothetical protein
MQTKEKNHLLRKKQLTPSELEQAKTNSELLLECDSVILGVWQIIWKDMCTSWKSMFFTVIAVLIFTSSWCLVGKKVLGYSVCVSCF